MSAPRVYLVRHGEVHNPARVRYGALPGFVLSDTGRAQTRAASAWLAARADPIGAVWCSPLERALETGELLASELTPARGPRVDARLIEASSWLDGLPRRPSMLAVARRLRERRGAAPVERWDAVARRMLAAIDDAARAGEARSVVLVSHQLPIQIVQLALTHGVGDERASLRARRAPWTLPRERCDHASVTVLERTPSGLCAAGYFAP